MRKVLPDCMDMVGLDSTGTTAAQVKRIADFCEKHIMDYGVFESCLEEVDEDVVDLLEVLTEHSDGTRFDMGECTILDSEFQTLQGQPAMEGYVLPVVTPHAFLYALITHVFKGYCDSSSKEMGCETTEVTHGWPVSTRLRLDEDLCGGLVSGKVIISVITDSDRKRTILSTNYDLNLNTLKEREGSCD